MVSDEPLDYQPIARTVTPDSSGLLVAGTHVLTANFKKELFATEVRRHVVGYLALMKAKYPSVPPEDYFQKITVSAKYTKYPPLLDVISFEELTGKDHAGEFELSLRECQGSITEVLNSSGTLGLTANQYSDGRFAGWIYTVYYLPNQEDSAKYEHRKGLPPSLRRTPGRTEDGVPLETTWDMYDEIILQGGLTTAVFSSPNPWQAIRRKTADFINNR